MADKPTQRCPATHMPILLVVKRCVRVAGHDTVTINHVDEDGRNWGTVTGGAAIKREDS